MLKERRRNDIVEATATFPWQSFEAGSKPPMSMLGEVVTTRNLFRAVLAVMISFAIAGCTDWPSEKDAERDFRADYPQYQLLKCYAGEGNSDAIYFHFEYRNEAGKLKTMRVLYDKKLGKQVWEHGRVDGQAPSNFPVVIPTPPKTN